MDPDPYASPLHQIPCELTASSVDLPRLLTNAGRMRWRTSTAWRPLRPCPPSPLRSWCAPGGVVSYERGTPVDLASVEKAVRCRANSAHVRKSRPDSGLDFLFKFLNIILSFSLFACMLWKSVLGWRRQRQLFPPSPPLSRSGPLTLLALK